MFCRVLGPVVGAVLASAFASLGPGHAAPAATSRPLVMAQASSGTEAPSRSIRKRSDSGPKKEPTARQMMARERQRTCAGEWKSAKAAGTTGGAKWPKFWSACNARLKGGSA
jgi:hypothetical protein